MSFVSDKLNKIVEAHTGNKIGASIAERLQKITNKASEYINGSITVDQTDPNDVKTTEKPSHLKEIGTTALGFLSNPVRGAGYLAANVANSFVTPKTQEEKQAQEQHLNDAEIQGQIETNKKLGNESDSLGNLITNTPQPQSQIETSLLQEKIKSTFDSETFRKGIVYNEVRGAIAAGEDPYQATGTTGDLGKYQTSPATLGNWSKAWLGKKYTPAEFLSDPQEQETFFNEFTKIADRLNLTLEQAAVAWHRGWGLLGEGPKGKERDQKFLDNLNGKMNEEVSQNYLKTFREGTSTNSQ